MQCRLYARDAETCVQECQALLNEPKLDTAIRTGDVYGLLIEHFAQAKHYREVVILIHHTALTEMCFCCI